MASRRLVRLGPAWRRAVVAVERAGQASPWTPAQLEAALTAPEVQVWGCLAPQQRLLGFAVLARLPFDAELQAITVMPASRRQGMARTLLTWLLAEARDWGSERLVLEVRASNAPAIALYRRLGFAEDGRRRGYYPSAAPGGRREEALLMSRNLVPEGRS